jgi:4-amino-4-deoxy-L-arabinose transferase-like glycosyltransferase
LIIILGLILRLIDITKPFSGLSGWNEGHYALAPLNYFKYGLFTPMNDYGLDFSTSPVLYWAIFVSFKLFGVHEWSARMPSLISGIISIWLIFLIAEILYNREIAHLSAFIAATAPGIVYFSRSVQLESTMVMFSLGAVLFLLYYGGTEKEIFYWLSTVSLSLAVLIKYTAVIIYPVILWLWFVSVKRSLSRLNISKLVFYLVLPLIPSLLWIYYAASVQPLFIYGYFFRPQDVLSTGIIIGALNKAIFTYLPWNLGKFQFYLLLLGAPIIVNSGRKLMPMILLSTTWIFLCMDCQF